MTTTMPSTTRSAPALHLPTSAEAAALAAERHPICLTLLMATVPGDRMVPGDRTKLNSLLRDAARRLEAEQDAQSVGALRAWLEDAVVAALAGPTGGWRFWPARRGPTCSNCGSLRETAS
jgi:hypothetical protein